MPFENTRRRINIFEYARVVENWLRSSIQLYNTPKYLALENYTKNYFDFLQNPEVLTHDL